MVLFFILIFGFLSSSNWQRVASWKYLAICYESVEKKTSKRGCAQTFVDIYITPREFNLCNLKKIPYV
jgi:hypothetical protein